MSGIIFCLYFFYNHYIGTGDNSETNAQSNEHNTSNTHHSSNKQKHHQGEQGKKGDTDTDSASSDISTIEVSSSPPTHCKFLTQVVVYSPTHPPNPTNPPCQWS